MPAQTKPPPQTPLPAKADADQASGMLHAGLLCGLIAPILWAAMIVITGELRPGFDHVVQYISELGERGSATEIPMRYGGFMATGLMHIGYALAFYATVNRATHRSRLTLIVALLIALNGLGRIGAGVFACEPGCAAPDVLSQRLHGQSATLAFLSIAGATLLSAMLFRSARRLRSLSAYSLVSGAAGLIFLALMSAGEATHAHTGLYERLASGVLTLWVLVTALRLRRIGHDI